MFSQAYAIGMMLKVLTVFVLQYIFLPSRITEFYEEADSFLDKVFISFTHGTFITIIIVHILVGLKLFDFFSLLFCLIVVYIFIIKYRGKSWQAVIDALGMRLVVRLLDLSEKQGDASDHLRGSVNFLKALYKQKRKDFVMGLMKVFICPYHGIFPIAVFLFAAFLRFKPALSHAAFLHIDMYLHMIWVKYLGVNQIYHDGVYPYGYHALVSAMSKLSFIDPYWLLRFLGPIGGALIVLSVYYFVMKTTKNPAAGLISLAIFGLVRTDFPGIMFRQTAALTQEFSLIYVLPGLYFLWLYLKTHKNSFLLLYAEALACTLFIHSYSALYLMIWSAVLVFCAVIYRLLNLKSFIKLVLFGFATGVIAMLPMGIGYLVIGKFHESSIKFVQENISGGHISSNILPLFTQMAANSNPFLIVIMPLSLMIMIYLFIIKRKEEAGLTLALLISTFVMYSLYSAPALNLPTISDPDRTAVFFALMLASFYAGGFNAVERVFLALRIINLQSWKAIVFRAASIVLCLTVIVRYPVGQLYRGIEEYEGAARSYLAIKQSFTSLDWTIIGPQEQLAQSINYGWHSDLLRFIKGYPVEEAADPSFDIPMPTTHVFIFTEKNPLGFNRTVIPEDAMEDLEPERNDPYMQYYKNPAQRAILEAKAILWAETYKKYHQNVGIFYEDEDIRIYHIQHVPPKIN